VSGHYDQNADIRRVVHEPLDLLARVKGSVADPIMTGRPPSPSPGREHSESFGDMITIVTAAMPAMSATDLELENIFADPPKEKFGARICRNQGR
jgi:hypothetical protein